MRAFVFCASVQFRSQNYTAQALVSSNGLGTNGYQKHQCGHHIPIPSQCHRAVPIVKAAPSSRQKHSEEHKCSAGKFVFLMALFRREFWWHLTGNISDSRAQAEARFHCTSSTITVAVSAQLPIHAVSCVHQFRDMNYSLELGLSATNWTQGNDNPSVHTADFKHAEFMCVALAECWGCEVLLKQVICEYMEQER